MIENCTLPRSDVRDTCKVFLVQCVNNSNLGNVGLIWLLCEATTKNIQKLETSSARILVTGSSIRKLQLQKEESVQEETKVEVDEGHHNFHRLRR